jgi:hypothetical protein
MVQTFPDFRVGNPMCKKRAKSSSRSNSMSESSESSRSTRCSFSLGQIESESTLDYVAVAGLDGVLARVELERSASGMNSGSDALDPLGVGESSRSTRCSLMVI